MIPYAIIYILLGAVFLRDPLLRIWHQGLCKESFRATMLKDTFLYVFLAFWITVTLLMFWPGVFLAMYLVTR